MATDKLSVWFLQSNNDLVGIHDFDGIEERSQLTCRATNRVLIYHSFPAILDVFSRQFPPAFMELHTFAEPEGPGFPIR